MIDGDSNREYLGLLIETDALVKMLHDSRFTIVDTRSNEEYIRGHIPNSVNVPNNTIKAQDNPTHVMQGGELSSLMLSLGINDNTHVIAYDDNFGLNATRLWWVLEYSGHTACSILDGGWVKWVNEEKEISAAIPDISGDGTFTTKLKDEVFCDIDRLKRSIKDESVFLWDVRSEAEYAGDNARNNNRVGHVPGAINLEWLNSVDNSTHVFKSTRDIRNMFLDIGIDLSKEIITY
jgi:thiosulfate/3-mercaptopyruvate sulfurtransferase